MRLQTTLRDQIYQMMDAIINHANSTEKELPQITLTSDQFQIFTDFNKPNYRGEFYYRNVAVKGKSNEMV